MKVFIVKMGTGDELAEEMWIDSVFSTDEKAVSYMNNVFEKEISLGNWKRKYGIDNYLSMIEREVQ